MVDNNGNTENVSTNPKNLSDVSQTSIQEPLIPENPPGMMVRTEGYDPRISKKKVYGIKREDR